MSIKCEREGGDSQPGGDALCSPCNTTEIVVMKGKRCEEDGCATRPSFNIKGGKARFCKSHKTAEMIDVISKRCEYEECESHPLFNFKGCNGRRFCGTHKTADMVDVTSKRCGYDGCDYRASFDIKGGKGSFCVTHKTDEMVDVKHKHCESDGCVSRPNFDIKGGKGSFCVTHKTVDMVDVKNKRCEYAGCDSQPAFGVNGGKGSFCAIHKTAEMVNVKNKRCEYTGCDSQPVFGIKGEKCRFCVAHKTAEMVDVKNKRCEYDGCDISPQFDIKGGKGSFCLTHKTAEMMDVRSKLCEREECKTRASYGKPGLKRSHCFQHRQNGMIRRPNAKCTLCKEFAIWGSNWVPKHCETHKENDDQNLVERPCISCGLMYVLDNEDRCEHCNPVSFTTARLAKQNALMSYLDARDLVGYSTDIAIDRGVCGKERPDRVYDFVDKIVVLECDENQHNDRPCLCEQTRMVNIGQSFGGTPVYFIRWNPDNYSPESDRKKPEELAKRHKLVGDLIRDIKNNKHTLPKGLVSVIYMYYDGWNSLTETEWQIITEIEA